MDNKKEELKGLLKEIVSETVDSELETIKAEAEAQKEANAKLLEANTTLKAEFDAWQEKSITLNQNTGEQKYIFKGYNVDRPSRNFLIDVSEELHKEVTENMIKALTSANTGDYALPHPYGEALLGLAELQSYALSRARIIRYPGNVLKVPIKNTRATVDAQAFGTANAAAALDLGQLTFTIDKRVGDYETIYNDVLRQENFDVVSQLVEPMMAEAIGQNFDGEMFTKTEFTTDVAAGGTEGTTFSGAIADDKITYSKLIDTEFAVEQERGVNPEWVMPRGVFKYIRKLTDDNGRPLWDRAMEGPAKSNLLGYPLFIVGTSALSATPANSAICAAFGDPNQYILGINQEMMFEVNPYILMKEAQTQFIAHATADGNIAAATAWAYIKRSDV